MDRKESYPVDYIFNRLENCTETHLNLDGDLIKTGSARYTLFKQNRFCVHCGVEGCFFRKEKTEKLSVYHLNLYAIKEDGTYVMCTKDHIIPKSRGGSNTMDNYQTMCSECNFAKSNDLEGEIVKHRVKTTIQRLLSLKKSTSYIEISRVAGVKKQKVIDILLTNKRFMEIDNKGKITKLFIDEDEWVE